MHPFADVVESFDKIKVAEAAELKGDLARIHSDLQRGRRIYRSAIKASPSDAKLHNKLGDRLQLHDWSARNLIGKAISHDPRYVTRITTWERRSICQEGPVRHRITSRGRWSSRTETNARRDLVTWPSPGPGWVRWIGR